MNRTVAEAVMALDEPYRSTILYRYLDGLPTSAIAERCGVSSDAVRQRLSRGLDQLRARLDREFGGDRIAWSAVLLTASRAGAGKSSIVSSLKLAGGSLMAKTGSNVAIGALALALLIGGGLIVLARSDRAVPRLAQSPELSSKPLESDSARIDPPSPHLDRVAAEVSAPQTSATDSTEAATLEILVLNKLTREPIPRVRITIGRMNRQEQKTIERIAHYHGDIEQETVTDDDGRSRLLFPSGVGSGVSAYYEPAAWGGVASIQSELSPGETRKVTLELTIGNDVRFFGRVLARDDRHPIAGASARVVTEASSPVLLEWASRQPSETNSPGDAIADAQGMFEVRTASWRDPYLSVQSSGFAAAVVFPVGHETTDDPQEVILDRAATLEAKVSDSSGSPIQGAHVELSVDARVLVQPRGEEVTLKRLAPAGKWSVDTSDDGRVTIEGLPPGTSLRSRLTRKGWSVRKDIEPFVLQPGETSRVEWTLGAGCTLSGRVIGSDGVAIPGVQLWLHPAASRRSLPFTSLGASSIVAESKSDDAGRYQFDSVAAGLWRLGPAPPPRLSKVANALAPSTDIIEVPDNARSVEHDLVVQRGLWIHGWVVDPSGAAVRRTVVMETPTGFSFWREQSNADGSFAAGPAAAGSYVLRALGEDQAADSEDVPVTAGDNGVVLKLREGASISGSVTDATSGALTAAGVVVCRQGAQDLAHSPNHSEDPGAFSFEGLPPSVYDLVARTKDGRVGISAGVIARGGVETKGVVISVSPGATLHLRYQGKAVGGAYRVTAGSVVITQNGIRKGETASETVPPGLVKVRFDSFDPEKTTEREVTVFTGEEKELVFGDDG